MDSGGIVVVEIDAAEFKVKLDQIIDNEEGSVEPLIIRLLAQTVANAINESMREHEAKYHMGDVK